MPRIDFAPEFKKAVTNYDFPKLKLKKDEQARILIYEQQPMTEYVHTMRAPKVVMGKPVMETKSRRDGSQYQDYAMDFLSKPICLGDFSTLQNDGSDPKNCPVCALAHESTDMAQAPQRRFAIHVIRYKTKSGSTKPAVPFSVELVVWSFTDKTYNKIEEFREEWGDLRQHDITLNCTNEPFQLYDVNISPIAEWQADDERKRLVVATFKENQIPDLSIACGSRKEKRWVDEDVRKIRQRWAEITGATASTPEDLDGALAGLFSGAPAEEPAQPPRTVESPGGSPSPQASSAPFDLEFAPPTSAPSPVPSNGVEAPLASAEKSLDDLLADLGED